MVERPSQMPCPLCTGVGGGRAGKRIQGRKRLRNKYHRKQFMDIIQDQAAARSTQAHRRAGAGWGCRTQDPGLGGPCEIRRPSKLRTEEGGGVINASRPLPATPLMTATFGASIRCDRDRALCFVPNRITPQIYFRWCLVSLAKSIHPPSPHIPQVRKPHRPQDPRTVIRHPPHDPSAGLAVAATRRRTRRLVIPVLQ